MTTVFPNFPYSLEDAPTEDWTVEEVLQYCLLQAHKETETKYQHIETSLNQQLEKGKEGIWQCHKKVLEAGKSNSPVNPSSGNTPAGTKKPDPKPQKKTATPTTVEIVIVGGHYAGNTHKLVPKVRHPCWVGRSQGKKFKDRGISLAKDLEISTTHGKFELKQGTLCYTDTGSTNGSKFRGEDLEADKPLPLETGMELTLGQSVLRITLS
ncbi:FHA domain [Seminavis robusta]|uniref:FHA domain n=1 Tax=Seminavis robusta TaxID=568900 RepID=A0A9N8EDR3_9STRA|nr:FHA domain [Seminavis robusta]|eukprot:Sro1027_g233080.1 FHA domain (210) ;mRNA; f:23951-24683